VSFLSRLFGRGAATGGGNVIWLYVRCQRCGETIRVRINRSTDAQQEYDDGGRFSHYALRKEILGNRCPNLMSVEMQLDQGGRIVEQHAEGCVVIDEQEYEAG
jgi:hypothetical protein